MATMQLSSSKLTHLHHQSSSIRKPSNNLPYNELFLNRRSTIAIALSTTFLAGESFISKQNAASAFDLRLTVPDQTVEEAEAVVKDHAQDLLQIKAFVESESWREAQSALRESSGYLKQDLYTIIQAKPGSQRPPLRKLYSNLFNNVSKLDYAARNKDADVVQECYHNIATILTEILAKI